MMRLEGEGPGGAAMRGGYAESGGNARFLKGMVVKGHITGLKAKGTERGPGLAASGGSPVR
jgi:hypothetical protein